MYFNNKGFRMIEKNVLEWINTHAYYPRNYKLEIPPYRVVVITDTVPDETAVPKFDVPIIFQQDRILALYIKEPDIRKDFASTDNILDALTSRGKGMFKINTAVLMVDKAENNLYELRSSLIRPYVSLIGYIMRLGLGLDELDVQYIKTYSALHYIYNSYGEEDRMEIVSKFNIGLDLPGFDVTEDKLFSTIGEDLATTLHDNVSSYETSRRLKSLKIQEYKEIFSSLVPMDMRPFMEAGLENNGVFASVMLEISTNLFYKKSKFGQFLMNNRKILDVDDVTKKIHNVINI